MSNFEAKTVLYEGFHAYDGVHEREQYASNIVATVADELEMVGEALECQEAFTETAARCVKRSVDRLRLALNVDDEETDFQKTKLPFIVPMDDDSKPDFAKARRATVADLAALGWVWRDSAANAVKAILAIPEEVVE